MSTRTGALPYSVGAQGLKARDRPLLFGGHLLHMPEAADWWDACSEGLAMGALALERIVHTLFNNFAEFSHIAGPVFITFQRANNGQVLESTLSNEPTASLGELINFCCHHGEPRLQDINALRIALQAFSRKLPSAFRKLSGCMHCAQG